MQIKDKKVLVTGAASGLGLAFARELLRNGAATVLIMDVQEVAGNAVAERLNSEFGRNRALFVKCDLTKSLEFENAFREAVSNLGGLDILVNNAGVINEVDFMQAVDVNVTAVIRGTLMGIQQMGKDTGGKGGVIVNVASLLGLEPLPELPVYSTTKHAVISFSRSLSQPYHYHRSGVRLLILCPGLTDTPMLQNVTSDNVESLEAVAELMEKYPPQRVNAVAHGLVYMIRCAQNGSIWIAEGGKPVYEIQMLDTLPMLVKEDQNLMEV